MFRSLKLLVHIDTTQKFNGFLYFLRQIPLVKKLFRKVTYEHDTAKKGFTITAIIYSIINTMFNTAFLLGVGIVGPLYLLQIEEKTNHFTEVYYYLFFLLYFLLPIISVKILEPNRRKLICVKIMKMDARKYVVADYLPKEIVRLVFEILAYYFISKAFGFSYSIALLLVLSKHFLAIFYEVVHILYYEKTRKVLIKKYGYVFIYALTILVLAYAFATQDMVPTIPSFVMIIFAIISIMLGLYAIHYLLNYENFGTTLNETNLFADFDMDKAKVNAQATFGNVKMKEKEFSDLELRTTEFEKLRGYDYLNAIFFKRHKRILYKPIKIQLIVIGIVFLLCTVALLVSSGFRASYVNDMTTHFPYLIFILYIMSTGSKASKAMFYNCDISLLRYGFYRDRRSLLRMFMIRLRYIILTNLMPASAIAASLLVLEMIAGGKVTAMVPIALLVLIMAMFFSVHHLFLYYIFQPYTTDLAVKNPFFSIFNTIVYILCYACIQIDSAPENFLLYTIIGTVVYMVIALVLVYKLADKTFRLR